MIIFISYARADDKPFVKQLHHPFHFISGRFGRGTNHAQAGAGNEKKGPGGGAAGHFNIRLESSYYSDEAPHSRNRFIQIIPFIFPATSPGLPATATPAPSSASTFYFAVPPPPLIMALAWPMVLPGGALVLITAIGLIRRLLYGDQTT